MKFSAGGLTLTCALMLSACARYPGMFYSEHTHFGLEVKINAQENKPVDVKLGYDRGIFTVVPRTEIEKDATSVISKTDLCVRFIESSVIKNVFASGKAATRITEEPARVEALFDPTKSSTTTMQAASGSCE